jgi:hypothetical protein
MAKEEKAPKRLLKVIMTTFYALFHPSFHFTEKLKRRFIVEEKAWKKRKI